LTLHAELHYLPTLNEVLRQQFRLIFKINEADSGHEMRNDKDFLTFKGRCHCLLASPWIRHWRVVQHVSCLKNCQSSL